MLSVKSLLLVHTFAVSCFTKTTWDQLGDGYGFPEYVSEFNKKYSTFEYNQRETVFLERLALIKAHNAKPSSWKAGVNHLTDSTEEELKKLRGYNKKMGYRSSNKNTGSFSRFKSSSFNDVPPSVDWREKGIISPVKDQGHCGSCWTFATVETLESHLAKATGSLMDLSEQELVNCVANPKHCGGTGGCEGATAELGFEYVAGNGLATEWTYPYISHGGVDSQACASNTTARFVSIDGFEKLPENDPTALLNAVSEVGPIAISVDASTWHLYESGVYNGCNQTNPDIDHAVQLVGYGTDSDLGLDYWLVRNSWQTTFGEQGYIRVERKKPEDVLCGKDISPADGTGCEDGPAVVTVCGTCGILYDSSFPTGVQLSNP